MISVRDVMVISTDNRVPFTVASLTMDGLRVHKSQTTDMYNLESRPLRRGELIKTPRIGDMLPQHWILYIDENRQLMMYAIPAAVIDHSESKTILEVMVDDVKENEYTIEQMMNITRSWLDL